MGATWEVRVSPASPVTDITCLKALRGIGGMPLGQLKAALAAAAPIYTTTLQLQLPGLRGRLANIRTIVDVLASPRRPSLGRQGGFTHQRRTQRRGLP